MSWFAEGLITVKCPRCGSDVTTTVPIEKIDLQESGVYDPEVRAAVAKEGSYTVRIFPASQINRNHQCRDNIPPTDRFIKSGELDDPYG